MKIAVAGVGYVGLSLAVLLSQHDEGYAVSTTPAKVELINSGKSPIKDKEIEEYSASCLASGAYMYWEDFKDKRLPAHKAFIFEGGDF